MDKTLGGLVVLAALCGCDYVPTAAQQEDTKSRVTSLEERVSRLENTEHAQKLAAIAEKNSPPAPANSTPAPLRATPEPGSWIMWQIQVSGPPGILGAYKEPQPLLAYAEQPHCERDIASNIERFKGNGATYTDATGYSYRLSCLPRSVDPR